MANTTANFAKTIHGTNPQFLVEKVIRSRIYDSQYWKEDCFALTAETIIDRAVELQYIGGTYGLQKPSPFLCLVCKLLQLQPDKSVILEYLKYEELKYLRAVAAMYARLTFKALDVYETLEPMLNDYRKLRFRQMSGSYHITHMDEFIDELLTQERVCELILPRLTKRDVVEEVEGLPPRISKLEDALLTEQDKVGNDSDASDSSTRERMRQRKIRIERAKRTREEREAAEEKRANLALGEGAAIYSKDEERAAEDDIMDEDLEADLPSQEEYSDEERYVSRSPSRSRSGSPASGAKLSDNGYVSRSPSRSPDRDGYVSRSPSRSPDRE